MSPIALNNFPELRPYTNIQPFTVRDGATYLLQLEGLKDWIRDTLVPHIDTEIEGLTESWSSNITELTEAYETAIQGLLDQMQLIADGVGDSVALAEAAATAAAASAALAASYASDAAEVVDPGVASLINDEESATRTALDALFVGVAAFTELSELVTEGRLSEEALDSVYAKLTDIAALDSALDTTNATVSELAGDLATFITNTATNFANVPGIADARIAADRTIFDIDRARLVYGIRLNNHKKFTVMQQVFISDKLNGEIFFSQLDGTDNGIDSFVITRCDPNGVPFEQMRFAGAGHGETFFIEVDISGNLWTWLSYKDYRVSTSHINRNNIVRVPWVAAGAHTIVTALDYIVTSISRTGLYAGVYYDEKADLVGIREPIDETDPMDGINYRVHTRANIIAGTVGSPIHSMSHTKASADYVGQGYAYLDGKWYLYNGSNPSTVPYDPARLTVVDAATGTELSSRTIESVRNIGYGKVEGVYSEPEGLCIGRGVNGTPSLILGVSYGPTNGRAHALYCLTMGETPFRGFGAALDFEYANTGWTTNFMSSWQSGFSGETADTKKLQARIAGGYLEFRGQILGTFVPGTNFVGTLQTGFSINQFISSAVQYPVTKSAASGNRDVSARLEIGTTSEIRIYTDADGSTNATWVSLDGVRIPLRRAFDGT